MGSFTGVCQHFALVEYCCAEDLYLGIDDQGQCWTISPDNNTQWTKVDDVITLALKGQVELIKFVTRMEHKFLRQKEARTSEPKLKPVRASAPFA